MRIRTLMLLVFAFFLIVPSIAQADIISTFDNDDEGWIADGAQKEYIPNNGYITLLDNVGGHVMAVSAPGNFLGDLTEYLNGVLAFDATKLNNNVSNVDAFGTVTIIGSGISVSYDLAPSGSPTTNGQWTTYSAELTTDIWGENLAAVLANVSEISVSLEYNNVLRGDLAGFDNFSITANSQQPVPEPGTLMLMVAGIAAIGVGRKLKNRSK